MAGVNLAAVLYKAGDMRLEVQPMPEPGLGEVQVAIQSVGVCATDVHWWVDGHIGDITVSKPTVLGHESAGIVSKLGPGVKNLKIGDRVALEPIIPCRICETCKSGRYHICADRKFLSLPPDSGMLRRYVAHPEDLCFKMPDHVSFDEGTFLEPASIALHAFQRGGLTVGHQVLICGAGPLGIMSMMVAKVHGAASVCLTDICESRLKVASSLGADSVVLVDTKESSRALADRIIATMGTMPDISVDCTGVESAILAAFYATRSGGKLLQVGLSDALFKIPIMEACIREVDIISCTMYTNCYPITLGMMASGKINVKPLITHHFPLEQILEAFQTAKTTAEGALKVMVNLA